MGFNTLQGGSGANAFNITANTPDTLLGGAGNDIFSLANGVSSTGTINGQGGVNTINYASYTTPVTVNVGAHTATGTNVLLNIENMIGGVAATSTLIAANATNAWAITGTNVGSISGPSPFSFTNVGNLTGGILNDSFTFAVGASLSGNAVGGSGTNTLNFSNLTTPVTTNITANNGGTATANGATFNFSGIANLVGGSGNNTFAFANGKTLSGTINGGVGGSNTLDYSAYTTSVRVESLALIAAAINGGR